MCSTRPLNMLGMKLWRVWAGACCLRPGAPQALSCRLGVPHHGFACSPYLHPLPQDTPGPSPVPMPRSLIYALSCEYFRRPLLEPQVRGEQGHVC